MTEFHPSITIPVCVMAVLTVLANAVVCFLVYQNKTMRTYTNGFVVSLAISDMITGLALFLQYSIRLDHYGLNVITNIIFAVVFFGGIANLCAVTFDRHLAVTRPLHYMAFMSRHFWKILLGCWTSALVVSVLPLCWMGNINLIVHKVYVIATLFLCIILPYALILLGNFKVRQQIRRCIHQERRMTHPSILYPAINSVEEDETLRPMRKKSTAKNHIKYSTETKVVKVIVIVASLFFISWLPVIYFSFVFTIGKKEYIPQVLVSISPFTLALSSLANPFLYSFMKPDFKEQICKILMFPKQRVCLPLRSNSDSETQTDRETTL